MIIYNRTKEHNKKKEGYTMKTISVYADPTILNSLVHERLDEIAERIPCFAAFRHGEITIKCREEDAAWVETMLEDLV